MRGSVQMRVPVQMARIGPDFWTGPCPSASYVLTVVRYAVCYALLSRCSLLGCNSRFALAVRLFLIRKEGL